MRSPKRQLPSTITGWRGTRPGATIVLVSANVAMFVFQLLLGQSTASGIVVPYLELSRAGIHQHFYWQFVSYLFLHTGPLTLAFSMLALFLAGREVESLLGPKHLIGIYLGGGVVGGIVQIAISPAACAGATAGVLAVVIAFTTVLPEIELMFLLALVIPIRIRAKYLAMSISAAAVGVAIWRPLPHLADVAQIGGIVFGWCYVKQLGYGNPLAIQRYIFERRQKAARLERMSPTQYIAEQVDPILDKIHRQGLQSLTRSERRILERGRDKIANKPAAR